MSFPEIIRQKFKGKYPVYKAFTLDFIRDGIKFQIDAIAYKGLDMSKTQRPKRKFENKRAD